MRVFYSFLLFLLPSLIFAQVDPGLAQALQDVLDEKRVEINAKGFGAAIVMPTDEVWEGVSGVSGTGTDLTTEFTFGVGSVTKTITAAILTELHVEGVLSLDDPLFKWLPTFPNVDSSATIRQCLNHTTGIFDYRADPDLFETVLADAEKVWTQEEIIENFVHAPNFAPGAGWSYSNTNYTLAGMVIKAATGKEYYEMYQEKLFEPLGLTTTIAAPFQMNNQPLADLWFDAVIPGFPLNLSNLYSLDGMFSIGNSAGGVVSTPKDIAKWMKALITGEAISEAAFEEMKGFLPVGGGGYGLGLTSGEVNGEAALGHSGNIVYVSEVFYFPEIDISIALHTNDGTKPDLSIAYAALLDTYKNYDPSKVTEISNEQSIEIYPNPVAEFVNLNFELNEKSEVQVSVFDISGKRVNTLFTGNLTSGKYQKRFDLNIAKGTYLIRLDIEGDSFVERIVKY